MPDTNKSIASILDDLYEKLTGVEDPTDDKYTIAQKLKQITSLFTEEELPEKATISGYLDIFKNAFNGGGGGNPDAAIEAFLKCEVEELTLQSEVLTAGMVPLLGGVKHIYAPNATEVQPYAIRPITYIVNNPGNGTQLFYSQLDYTPYEIDWEHPQICNQGDLYFEYAIYPDVMQSVVLTEPIFMNFSIDLPEVTNIEDLAFANAKGLTMINTGNKLIRIGYSAFDSCKTLQQVPNWSNKLMIIEDKAFMACENMRGSVYIPDTITYLGPMAFANTGIDEINIGGLQFIPFELCRNCYNLKKINIRDGVQFIRSSAFNMTYSANEIHFPGTLKMLEENSFFACYGPVVTIPRTYHINNADYIYHQLRIGSSAFYLSNLYDSISITSLLEKLVPDIDDRHVEPGTTLNIQICIDLSEHNVNIDFQPPIVDSMSAFYGSTGDITGWTGYMLDSTRNISYRVRYVFLFNDQDTLDAFKQLTNWASYDVDRFMLKSNYAGPLGDQPGYFNNLESGDE